MARTKQTARCAAQPVSKSTPATFKSKARAGKQKRSNSPD
jgi:hypothetical protein